MIFYSNKIMNVNYYLNFSVYVFYDLIKFAKNISKRVENKVSKQYPTS